MARLDTTTDIIDRYRVTWLGGERYFFLYSRARKFLHQVGIKEPTESFRLRYCTAKS